MTITGKFKDSNGNVLKTESKTFEGFPAGWSNYFVFQPGIKYSSASWEMTADEYGDNVYADCFEIGNNVYCKIGRFRVNDQGELQYSGTPEELANLKEMVGVWIYYGTLNNKQNIPLWVNVDTVIFDKNGDICYIGRVGKGNYVNPPYDDYITIPFYSTDIPWENKDEYTLPDNLKNITGIIAYTYVGDQPRA